MGWFHLLEAAVLVLFGLSCAKYLLR